MDTKIYYGEYSLKHWIELILAKQITLPEYQRSFVWKKKDVCLFVQSLKRNEFVPPVTIGAFFNEDGKEVNYIIDGQQRLTSILLAYLGYYPNVEKFINNDMLHTSSDDILEEENEDKDIVLKWTYLELLKNPYKNKKEIIENIKKSPENYDSIDESLVDDLDRIFLGFSYIVPLDKNEQIKYYSSVFRHMNISGVKLLPQETRESLYFLDKEKLPFFKNQIFSKCSVNNLKVDFVRYAAFASQYKLLNSTTGIMKNFARKEEEFYEEFIYSIINPESEAAKKEIFAKFEDSYTNKFNENFNKLQKYIKDLHLETKYSSIIDADISLFGLFYFVLLCNKKIDTDVKTITKLHSDLERKTNNIKDDYTVYKNPSLLKNLRMRLNDSINIYNLYVKDEDIFDVTE